MVDSGSTATLLSKQAFDKMTPGSIDLQQKSIVLQNVDGKNINVYGSAEVNISFDDNHMRHNFIVCDMTPEGLLGHDFPFKHIKTWDLETPCLRTRQNSEIRLETGGERQVVCRVLVQDRTQIPPHSVSFVPVNINDKQLAATGYIEGIETENITQIQATIVPGIVDPHNDEKGVAIMNTGGECITFYPGAAVATCNSSYETLATNHETEITGIDNPQEPEVMVLAEKPCSVPSHLKDMFEKSSALLNKEEKGLFSKLLIKYRIVFSRSSDDLGQADRVKAKN